jgi:hypothetical protein
VSDPASGGATTGAVNPIELAPFSVLQATTPALFDPSANTFNNKLPLSFVIRDPNALIRGGRILYTTTVDGREVILKRTRIPAGLLAHGPQVLSPADQWNGQIDEGLDDRRGEFITADLSPLMVEIQVWNNTSPEPETPLHGNHGSTRRDGEWLARAIAVFDLDCFVQAVWERNWCVPYQEPGSNVDPGDEGKGQVGMTIEVKNVRENTPAHVTVSRIGAVASPGDDLYYTDSNDVDRQPGLQNLVVQNHKVFCPDSSGDPYVRFNNYEEHWTQPGNNFYCFSVAFGTGAAIMASERDWENNEAACLHMRFTVVVVCSASRGEGDIHSYARQIHNVFANDTRYYRSYLFKDPPSSEMHYLKTMRRRYILRGTRGGGLFALGTSQEADLAALARIADTRPDTGGGGTRADSGRRASYDRGASPGACGVRDRHFNARTEQSQRGPRRRCGHSARSASGGHRTLQPLLSGVFSREHDGPVCLVRRRETVGCRFPIQEGIPGAI